MSSTTYIVQFVDSIAASPAIRLDLVNGPWTFLASGWEAPPPSLDRAVVQTMLADGALIPAASYGNRQIRIGLQLKGGPNVSDDQAAVYLQQLMREIDRKNNILKWQPGGSFPAFFRTFRGDVDVVSWDPNVKEVHITLPAEPFVMGLRETVAPITVSNDPAAGSNGCFFEVSSVKGDVETPLILKRPTTTVGEQSILAVRRRGTPSSAPFLLQAEALTQSTDTTTQPNSATFSGAGNNFSRTTFATVSTLSLRMSVSKTPGSPSINTRGMYRVFMRCRRNGVSSALAVRMSYATPSVAAGHVFNDTVTIPLVNTVVQWVDVGTVSVPVGNDPVYDGYSNVELACEGVWFGIEASRTAGTDTLDYDCFLWMPADDRFAVIAWTPDGTAGSSDRLIADGTSDTIYGLLNATGELTSLGLPYFVGGLPMLSPSPATNRVYHLNEVSPGVAETTWPTTWSFEPFYYPRYLYAAPS